MIVRYFKRESVDTDAEIKRLGALLMTTYPAPIVLTAADAGCYVDGHWGQYAVAHMVNRAEEFGYNDHEVIDLADRHLASMGPSDAPGLTLDEHEALSDASDEVEQWLNDHVAPEGYSFGWQDGEFYLWSDATWEDPWNSDEFGAVDS